MNLYPTVVLFVFIYSSLTVREIASLYSHSAMREGREKVESHSAVREGREKVESHSAMSEAGRERLFTFTALHRVALLLYGNSPF